MVEFLYLIPIGGRIIKLTTVEKSGHYKFYGPFGTKKKYIYIIEQKLRQSVIEITHIRLALNIFMDLHNVSKFGKVEKMRSQIFLWVRIHSNLSIIECNCLATYHRPTRIMVRYFVVTLSP